MNASVAGLFLFLAELQKIIERLVFFMERPAASGNRIMTTERLVIF